MTDPGVSHTGLSHVDSEGRAQMVDVSSKPDTRREAVATADVVMLPATVQLIRTHGFAKGDVLTVARIAGIQAAKRTAELIPMCHPLLILDVGVDLSLEVDRVRIVTRVVTIGKTGAEMEALTAATVAGLTIYDMCKAADRGMELTGARLLKKSGGKSDWVSEPTGD